MRKYRSESLIVPLFTCISNFRNKGIYFSVGRDFILYEMKMLGIEEYSDDIYFSSDYKMCKPDKKIFERLIKDKKLDVSKSIMIGNDPLCDINGAAHSGLDTLYIKSNLSREKYDKSNPSYKILGGNIRNKTSMIIK
ncbi:HAD family hydrolase [uncultured Clostridium sp.]|uniref:HAD family hydrolase n=1 Tax=uncultured Clostridium sp. TaxID=59620 RepID=UPI0025E39369|nr:HAD family hydrolase [uncultured Clostridium sp.]